MDIWGLLTEFINNGLILQGTIGEIIGWVLSLLSMDDTIDALTDGSQLKYQMPVSVAHESQEHVTPCLVCRVINKGLKQI